MNPITLALDLDGTLIDSSAGILYAASQALAECGYHSIGIDSTVVGPPLSSVFRRLLPCAEDSEISQLCHVFREYYDFDGYLRSCPYEGIEEAIEGLINKGSRLVIVTNKRAKPAQKIIELFNWSHYFECVYSVDMHKSATATKADALVSVIQSLRLDPLTTPYLGDRVGDFMAAKSVSMPFLLAAWGYASPGEFDGLTGFNQVKSPGAIINSLAI